MKTLLLGAFLILSVLSAHAMTTTTTTDKTDAAYQYEDYNDEELDQEEVLFNEDKPCPRDCKCIASTGSKLAKCWRLEIGTQKFGDDITDLSVENVDAKHPIVLSDMMFRKLGLHQVTNVKISNSVIKSISPLAFRGLHELYSVNMSGNSIQRIDPNTFAYNSKLALLTLSDNPLALNKLGNSLFLNSTSIQELDISRCSLTSLPKKTFSKLPKLMYINLSGNKLLEIDSDVFSELGDLEEIDLSDNFLKSVPGDLFKNNSEMATLKLGGNPLETVNGLEIAELLTLDLGVSQIKNIGPSMFDGMTYISSLNLSGNGVHRIHNQAFRNLRDMSFLDLSHNRLDMISSELIKENVELDVVKVSHNPFLKSLPSEGFSCAGERFNIYLFDASYCSLEILSNNTFKTMSALSQLDLSHNNIRSLGSSLKYITRLVEIDLSYNLLASLPEHTFDNNRDLGKLDLAGNPLTTLSPTLFKYSASLTWLDVSSCRLNSIWSGDFDMSDLMTNLNFVNASNNQIASVKTKELKVMPRLYTLDIQMNPLECDRDFEILMRWLYKANVSPAEKEVRAQLDEFGKKTENKGTWESLAKQICGSPLLLKPGKTEEVKPIKKEENETDYDEDEDADADDVDDDEYDNDSEEGDDEDDYDEDDKFMDNNDITKDSKNVTAVEKVLLDAKEKVTNKIAMNHNMDDVEDDVAVIKNKVDKTTSNQIGGELFEQIVKDAEEKLEEMESDNVGIKIYNLKPGVYENGFIDDELIAENIPMESTQMTYYSMLLKPLVIALGMVLIVILLFSICYQRKLKNVCVISSISGNANGKTKKDCGLVYQQLSENLTGPKTPIISRHAPMKGVTSQVTNISYKSSQFHHSNITPESV